MDNKVTAIWGVRILDEGFTQIPNLLIRNYRELGIEHGEFGLICTILTYQFDTRDPYPSIETLAKHMRVNKRQIDKWIQKIKDKKLMRIGRRRNVSSKQFGENFYNFKPLIDKLMDLIGESRLPESHFSQYEIEYDDEPYVPEVRTASNHEPSVPVDTEPYVPQDTTPNDPVVPNPNVPSVRPNNRSLNNTNKNNNKDLRYSEFYRLFPD